MMVRARQPIRVAPDQPYGQRKALEGLQKAAPMTGGTTQPQAQPSAGRPSQAAAPQPMNSPAFGRDAFGPTQRPSEPITQGVPSGPGSQGSSWYLRQDPKSLLRAAYEAYPDPWILRLLSEEPAPDPFFKPVAAKRRFSPPPPVLKPAP